MPTPIRVLIVEDSADDAELMLLELRREGYAPAWERVETADGMRAALAGPWDVILSDYTLPRFGAMAAMEVAAEAAPDVPLVVVSGTVGEDVAVAAMRAGASDYVLKRSLARLGPAVARELREADNRRERRRAERAAFRLAAIVQSSDDAVIGTALDGVIADWNPGAERLYGYAAAEVVGRHVSLLVPPDQADELAAVMARVRAGEPVPPFDTVRLHKDGTRVDVAVTASPVRDGDGRLVGVSKIARDIRGKRRAEQALRASESRFRAIIEKSFDAVVLTGADGRLGYASPASARILGRDLRELAGRDGFSLLHPDDLPRVRTLWAGLLKAPGGTMASTHRATRGGRDWRWVEAQCTNLLDDPNVRAVVINFRDVTEQREAERRLQAVADQAPVLLAQVDADCRYTFVNRPYAARFGQAPADLIGRGLADVLGEAAYRAIARHVDAALAGRRVEFEAEVPYAGIGPQHVHAAYEPEADDGGRVRGFVAAITNVTERKRLEEQFRQAQKMEAVGRLAGGVAHDFNNLLTVINGYGDLVMEGLRPGDPAGPLVGEIRKAGERAAGLTRQLLAFSRKTVLEPKVVDPNALVRDMAGLLRRLIGEDILLATALDPDAGRVKVDPGQLEQAVVNLAVNARDAMPQGGRLTIETRNAEPDDARDRGHPGVRPGRYVVLAVADTGHGMDAATKARLFEPFFTTKGQGKGTGLGLAMVYGFVEQSGGYVVVDSEPGLGSTFRVYLPRVEEEASGGKSHAGLGRMPRGTETVLLVEDEDGVRALTRHILQSCGYAVLDAGYGQEAVRAADRHAGAIHLLITDVVMPEMSGRQVVEAVRARHPSARVLFVSGYTDDAVMRHGILEADVNFLQKPFTPASLAQKVREVLDQ